MFYLHNLRVRLQERRNRLYKTGPQTYETELHYLFHFLDSNSYIRSLLTTIDASPSVDFEQWVADHSSARHLQFPGSEEGRAKVCYGILKRCAGVQDWQQWNRWLDMFTSTGDLDSKFRDFTEAVVDPLVNFLHDQIDDGGNVLYLIERFKLKAEWFRRQELHNHYKNDTSVGERSLDRELRASLFEGGVDYPFSQPSSPSGEADIVALLGSNDPLVLEVKVFDLESGKGKSNLRQGFHQVVSYANDYNESLGYLVIFNCSDRKLVISSDEASEPEVPSRITYGGKLFFIVSIDIHPDTVSASKEKSASRITVSHRELVGEQEAAGS